MTRHGEHDRDEPLPSGRQTGAGEDGRAEGGKIPPPDPEEAPELLGDRSDYPLPNAPGR